MTTLKEQLSDLHIIKTQITEITNHLSASTNHFSQNRIISLFVLRLSPDSNCEDVSFIVKKALKVDKILCEKLQSCHPRPGFI